MILFLVILKYPNQSSDVYKIAGLDRGIGKCNASP